MCALRKLPRGFVWVNNHLPTASQHRKASVLLFQRISRVSRTARSTNAHGLARWKSQLTLVALRVPCVFLQYAMALMEMRPIVHALIADVVLLADMKSSLL